jgi:hypothetical protein
MTDTATTATTETTTPAAAPADPAKLAAKAAKDAKVGLIATAILALIPADKWDGIVVKRDDGSVDMDESRRAFGNAVRDHLKAAGVPVGPARRTHAVDFSNLEKAIAYTFTQLTKDKGGQLPSLTEMQYATCASLQVPFSDMDKAKDQVRKALDQASSQFQLVKGPSRWAGDKVGPKDGQTVTVVPFASWADMHKAAEPAPAAAPASNGAADVAGHSAPAAPSKRKR